MTDTNAPFTPGPGDEPSAESLPESSQPSAPENGGEPGAPFPPGGSPDLPPDIRTPLGWFDLLYLGIFYVIAGLMISLGIAAIAIFAYHVPPGMLRKPGGPQATVLIVSQALLSGVTMIFLFVMVRSHGTMPFWPAVGWRDFRNVASRLATGVGYVLGGAVLVVFVAAVTRFMGEPSALPIDQMFRNRESVLLLTALGILVAPVVEETVFRGCIYPVVARKFGVLAGVLATGTLFGIAHAQQLGGHLPQIALLIVVGIVLTYVRARAGTVFASYLMHVTYNTILFAAFYYATGGLRHFPPV